MSIAATALFAAAGYLAGSVSTAVVVSRAFGAADPRAGGSGNPGATNVLRLAGRGAAALTLAGDVLKGLAPVLAARALDLPPLALALTGLAAFLGHLYPVFFRFRGGKGVATALGALTGVEPLLGAAVLATWLAVAALSRYSSLAALTASALTPVYALAIHEDPRVAAVTAVMAALLVWRHRANVRRLMAGEESRIGARSGEHGNGGDGRGGGDGERS